MQETIFRDPVHKDILIKHPLIFDLINTREFQRLRRIKQVPTTSFTFHGAEHSRFTHCLGVYEIARRATEMFEAKYPDQWQKEESLVTLVAALLHDIGHGAYSHTFERLFDTDHERITQEIITNPDTEINKILRTQGLDFPNKVASVINHTYPNKQVSQLISSQIDCDRMDYLLRDAYYTGVNYGQFDLTRILSLMQPTDNGIAFASNALHAVEDYLVSRYQMYMQVYFHPASRAVEVLLQNLLKRAKWLFDKTPAYFEKESPNLVPFLTGQATLSDYLALDDGVMNSYFQNWIQAPDTILADLSKRFTNRQIFKSIALSTTNKQALDKLQKIVQAVGYDPDYYTAIHDNFDLPYDIYRPDAKNPRTEIQFLDHHGKRHELSELSIIVQALSGKTQGDRRFYFPKEMLSNDSLFNDQYQEFQQILQEETLNH